MPNVHPLVALLVEERKRQGLSQRDVAERSGVARSSISETESGLHDPNLRTFCALAGALGFEVLTRSAEPVNDIDATGECCCNGCIGEGLCDLEIGQPECDEDENRCEFCASDCQICSGTPECDCPTHGGLDAA